MNRPHILPALLMLSASAPGADIYKANNTNPLQNGSAWFGSIAPGPNDTAVFSSLAGTSRSSLGADAHWRGISVTADATQTAGIDKASASAPEILFTLGAGGISTLNVNKGVQLGSNVLLSADQTWTTTGTVPAAGISYLSPLKENNEASVNFGGYTVTKNGPSQVAFGTNTNGHCTIRNGTVVMNAGVLQISSAVQMTIATPVPYMRVLPDFTIRLNAGSSLVPFNQHASVRNLLWSPRVELNGGTLYGCGAQVIFGDGRSWPSNLGGIIDVQSSSVLELSSDINNLVAQHEISASITGSATLALRNNTALSAQSEHRLVLTGNNAAFTGGFTLDGSAGRRSVRLRGSQSGSATAAWSVQNLNTLEVEASDVQLGSLAGGTTGTLTAVGGGTSVVTLGARNANTSFPGIITNAAGSVLTLRKVGTGSQSLTSISSAWLGDTLVEGGILSLSSLLDDASTVRIASGAVLRVKSGTTDTVAQLFLNGVAQPAGTYGATGSTATFQSAHFGGTGILDVQPGPSLNPYTSWIHTFPGLDSPAERAESFDADGDGLTNFAEFVTLDNPASTAQNPLIREVREPGGEITFVLPVTNITYPGLTIQVQASSDLTAFSLPVTAVPGWTPPASWPALPATWEYRAWRGPSGAARLFFKATVTH